MRAGRRATRARRSPGSRGSGCRSGGWRRALRCCSASRRAYSSRIRCASGPAACSSQRCSSGSAPGSCCSNSSRPAMPAGRPACHGHRPLPDSSACGLSGGQLQPAEAGPGDAHQPRLPGSPVSTGLMPGALLPLSFRRASICGSGRSGPGAARVASGATMFVAAPPSRPAGRAPAGSAARSAEPRPSAAGSRSRHARPAARIHRAGLQRDLDRTAKQF